MDIPNVPQGLTMNILLERTKHQMGSQFFTYQSNSNNCQHFQLNLLHANGMLNENFSQFIKQDATSVFKNNPNLRKFANTLTDIGQKANVVLNGAGLTTI